MTNQLARGSFTDYSPTESAFAGPNSMHVNIKLWDDHMGLYTMQPPVAPGTPLPDTPENGSGQAYTDGTYAVFNGGSWTMYPPRPGIRIVAAAGTESWLNTGDGWAAYSIIDTQPAIDAALAALAPVAAQVAAEVDLAVAARDEAMRFIGMYPGMEEALNGAPGWPQVADGHFFSLVHPDLKGYSKLYRRSGTEAIFLKDYPSSAALEEILDVIGENAPAALVFAILDAYEKVALGIEPDGTALAARLRLLDALIIGTTSLLTSHRPEHSFVVEDTSGRVAFGVPRSGVEDFREPPADYGVDRYGGVYPAMLSSVVMAGQSLAQGPTGGISTVQEYDSVGFPNASSGPISLLPLTIGQTSQSGVSESPIYGACSMIKELILKENGLTWQKNRFQLVGCNNGSSGAPIDEISKGGSRGRFETSISQIRSASRIAASERRTFSHLATLWVQGHGDLGMPMTTYKTKLKQVAADYRTDGKAVSGQHRDAPFIMAQLCNADGLETVTQAQNEAVDEVPYIHIATPTYFFTHTDGVHLTPLDSKWLGAYLGLAAKRLEIDRQAFTGARELYAFFDGYAAEVGFSMPKLVFDTTFVPLQEDHGFTVFDDLGVRQAILSKRAIGSRLRITFARQPSAGWTIKYGHIAVQGKAGYPGPGGNLCGAQGDRLRFDAIDRPMNDFCRLFKITL